VLDIDLCAGCFQHWLVSIIYLQTLLAAALMAILSCVIWFRLKRIPFQARPAGIMMALFMAIALGVGWGFDHPNHPILGHIALANLQFIVGLYVVSRYQQAVYGIPPPR
jgi:hypothetical protein